MRRYQLEAAIQPAHAVRRFRRTPDWTLLEQLYDALLAVTRSPVVALNRAMVLAETRGPASGLAALDALGGDARLVGYQPYWAARAELLARCNRGHEAGLAYGRAMDLETDEGVRLYLRARRGALGAA